jgi:hypothetical protein
MKRRAVGASTQARQARKHASTRCSTTSQCMNRMHVPHGPSCTACVAPHTLNGSVLRAIACALSPQAWHSPTVDLSCCLPATSIAHTFRCGTAPEAECQKAHWAEGGRKKQCKDLQTAAASKAKWGFKEKLPSAPTSRRTPSVATPNISDSRVCVICLEHDPPPIRSGCACRGDAGLAHVQCRIAAAEHKYKSSGTIVAWNDCPTCCQSYRGQIAIGLAEEHFRQAQNRPERLEEWVLAAYLLANTLLGVGWIADAERVSRETLTKFDRMGLDDNFGSMRELRKASAHALDTQGKYADAHVIFTRCLAEHRQLYGPDNILTLRAAKALGNNLNRQAMYDKAVAILQDTLERCKRGLDPEDYLTLECASLLAMVLSAQGNANEAQAAFEQLMPVMKRVLGPDHQEVLQAATNCALSFLRSGRLVEGEAMLVETLAAQKKTLGDEHPLTVHSASILRSLRKKM